MAAVLLLLAVLQAANGVFGLFDGIPGYRTTYQDEAWGFTIHPPRPYVVKEEEEDFTQRVLIVFDPDVWDRDDPGMSAMLVYPGRPDDYWQPAMADVIESGDEWADDAVGDLRIRASVSQIEVRETRARLVGGSSCSAGPASLRTRD
jgi:hypothetical protein